MKKKTFKHQLTTVCLVAFSIFLVNPTSILASNPPTDNEITNAVNRQLMLNSTTPFHLIDVETNEGIVTLSGSVDNLLAKDRSIKVARMVRGVRAVIDKIEVDPPLRSDATLGREVKAALINDPATESYKITVDVNNGEATLSGTLDSWQEKQISGFVAKSVEGIKAIHNKIDVEYETERSDHEIKQDIKQSMKYDIRLDHALIDVEVDHGHVILSGTVGSASEKQMAFADSWVLGVHSVDIDDLEVKDWARNEDMRKGKYASKSDQEIKNAIKDAFLYDPRVLSFKPEVSVDNGYVTLSGTVNNLQAKRAAEKDARNVVGVLGVNNNLKVRPINIPEDSQLQEDIRKKLSEHPFVDREQIDVTAYNGIIYLNGKVDSYLEKSQAGAIAAKTKGVVDVENDLDVKTGDGYDYYYYYGWNSYYPPMYDIKVHPVIKSDSEIKNDIQHQLWWSPYVNEDDIDVSVSNGNVILEGTVDTRKEKQFAEINAIEGGARDVDNNIIVLY